MTALISISVAVLMTAACGGLVAYARHEAEQNARAALKIVTEKLSHEFRTDKDSKDLPKFLGEEREDLKPDDLALFLMDDRSVVWSTAPNAPKHAPVTGRDWRIARIPAHQYALVIALPWTKTESSLRSLTESLALLGIFVVVLATVGAWLLVGRTLSPIGRLSRQANAATADSLSVRLSEPSQDAEIVGLVGTLNGLFARLSETASAKGRFYSAASHELRTPLQALSGHLELALTRDRTQEEYRATIEEAYRQTQRLTKLTRSLLMLYQLDSSASTFPDETCDLASICSESIEQFGPLAEERGLRLSVELPESAPFVAPATHAEVLVRNLIENSIRYATDGGQVKVRVTVAAEGLELGVFNECSHPTDSDPERLFEPFLRPDASRTASTGGTGLGLTICRSIADVNDWTLAISRESDGCLATVFIPIR